MEPVPFVIEEKKDYFALTEMFKNPMILKRYSIRTQYWAWLLAFCSKLLIVLVLGICSLIMLSPMLPFITRVFTVFFMIAGGVLILVLFEMLFRAFWYITQE